jgi:hypothetical protein
MSIAALTGMYFWNAKNFDLIKIICYNTSITNQEKHMSNTRIFSADQTKKLNQVINEGMQVMHEIETLTGGFNDTVKAIAEELDIKPNILKKAIKLAHKSEFGREQQDHELLEQILVTVGKTL